MKTLNFIGFIGAAGILAACAQQEEVTVVAPQPIFDKFGNAECVEGYILVPGTAPIPECIPEDECEEIVTADGNVIPCPPPPGRPDDDDDDDDDRGRSPTGARP